MKLKKLEFKQNMKKERFEYEKENYIQQFTAEREDKKIKLTADTNRIIAITNLIRLINEKINIKDMPPVFQSYLVSLVFNGQINVEALSKAEMENILKTQ